MRKTTGDANGMMADLNQGLSRQPNNAAARKARGEAFLRTKNYAKAIDEFGAVVRLQPGDATAYYLRGQARERNGERDKAVADYKLALARDGNLREAQKALSSALGEDRQPVKRAALPEPIADTSTDAPDAVRVATPLPLPRPGTGSKPTALKPEPVSTPEVAARPEPAPETTASIPPAAAKPDAQPDRKRRETARERAKREYEARQRARYERQLRSARQRTRELTPSEKRRLYFEQLKQEERQKARRRGSTRFTDIWNERR